MIGNDNINKCIWNNPCLVMKVRFLSVLACFLSCFLLAGCSTLRHNFTVILDPGHTPKNPGVISCFGVPEYRYNNELTHTIERRLTEVSGVLSKRSRLDEQNLELIERVRDTAGTNVFLSIHHDSVQSQFLTVQQIDGVDHYCSDYSRGFSLFVSRKNPYFKQSLSFARRLGKELVARGLRPNLSHGEPIAGESKPIIFKDYGVYSFDDLIVLKASHAPAVLLEAGVIVNPVDEAMITSDSFRSIVSDAVVEVLKSIASEH